MPFDLHARDFSAHQDQQFHELTLSNDVNKSDTEYSFSTGIKENLIIPTNTDKETSNSVQNMDPPEVISPTSTIGSLDSQFENDDKVLLLTFNSSHRFLLYFLRIIVILINIEFRFTASKTITFTTPSSAW